MFNVKFYAFIKMNNNNNTYIHKDSIKFLNNDLFIICTAIAGKFFFLYIFFLKCVHYLSNILYNSQIWAIIFVEDKNKHFLYLYNKNQKPI